MAIGEVFVNTVTYTRMYICELIRQSRRFVGALGWGYALLSSCCRKRLVNKLGVKGDVGMGHWSRHATHWMTAATEFNCSCKTMYVYSICEKSAANWNGIFSQAICLFSCTFCLRLSRYDYLFFIMYSTPFHLLALFHAVGSDNCQSALSNGCAAILDYLLRFINMDLLKAYLTELFKYINI